MILHCPTLFYFSELLLSIIMTISEVAFNLIKDNIPMFGSLLFIFILIDILGWAFLGRRK